MLCVWVHGCDPGRVWLHYTKLSLSSALPYLLLVFYVLCAIIVPFFLSFLCCFVFVLFLCSCSSWSFVDVPLIFF